MFTVWCDTRLTLDQTLSVLRVYWAEHPPHAHTMDEEEYDQYQLWLQNLGLEQHATKHTLVIRDAARYMLARIRYGF